MFTGRERREGKGNNPATKTLYRKRLAFVSLEPKSADDSLGSSRPSITLFLSLSLSLCLSLCVNKIKDKSIKVGDVCDLMGGGGGGGEGGGRGGERKKKNCGQRNRVLSSNRYQFPVLWMSSCHSCDPDLH